METTLQRFKLTIAYRGTRYHGWQQQPVLPNWKGLRPPPGEGLPTIQEKLARAIGIVVGHPVTVIGSSRTDSGVHAKGQIVHFDTTQESIPPLNLLRAANHKLPGDILIRDAERVPQSFHAIHSTVCKRYQYSIWNSLDRPVFFNDLAWHRWQELDVDAMKRAAAHFNGTHDFASFCRPGHGRDHTVRTVHNCSVTARLPRIVVGVEGAGFLWNMVRIMVGTLVQVGLGNYRAEQIPEMLAACDRKSSGPTAPAHGLFLHWIQYETPEEDPAQAADAGADASRPEAETPEDLEAAATESEE